MAEKHIEAYLKKRVEALGGLCLKFTSPSRRGVADRLVISASGLTFYVELKYGRNGLSPAQVLFAKELNKRGVKVHYPRTKEEVDYFIDNIYF